MKKNSAFKLKSGNKPSIAKLSGVMKESPAKYGYTRKIKMVENPDGSKVLPKTKPKLADPVSKPKKKADPVSKPKKKVTFAEAYKNRDMKTYGNLNLKEYTAEAKRQIANKKATSKRRPKTHAELQSEMPGGKNFKKSEPRGSGERMITPKGSWDAPKGQMKGSLKPADKVTTKKAKTKTDLIVTKDAKKVQSVKDARAKRKEARKAVRTARKTSGRGSAEVKAAKEARKTARKNVRIAKKNRRATRKQTKSFLKN